MGTFEGLELCCHVGLEGTGHLEPLITEPTSRVLSHQELWRGLPLALQMAFITSISLMEKLRPRETKAQQAPSGGHVPCLGFLPCRG